MLRFLDRMWNLWRGDIPYPRRKGESRKTWHERVYAQFERDVPDSVYWLGEDSAAYLFGFSIANALWRAFLIALAVITFLVWFLG